MNTLDRASDRLVTLTLPMPELRAHLLRSLLEYNDVDATVVGGTLEGLWGVMGDTSRVLVRLEDRPRAVRVLEELIELSHDGTALSHPRCLVCRYDMKGLAEDRTVCPECGADMGELAKMSMVGIVEPIDTPLWVLLAGWIGAGIALGAVGFTLWLMFGPRP